MNHYTQRPRFAQRTKAARRIRIVEHATQAKLFHVIVISVGEKTDQYRLRFIPSDLGEGFHLEKLGGDKATYDVNLDADPDGKRHLCDCLGFLKCGRCKHVEGLNALRKAGKL